MALFSMESRFMKFMDRLVDVLLLNLLWLITSLPLVTLGAATAAAFSVTLKMVDDEEGPLVRTFFRAFRANFRQATGLWLLQAVALAALFLDARILSATDDPSLAVLIVSAVSAGFVFFAYLYAYPLAVRYDAPLARTLTNSLRLSFQHWGRTLLLLAVVALELALFFWNTSMMVVGVLIGPMVLIYTISGVSKGIFQRETAA